MDQAGPLPPPHRPAPRQLALVLLVAAGIVTSLGVLLPHRGDALPQYAARSARTCDNCHADPTDWRDPALLERKCSLDCSVCHVDPTGGGMRNVGGYYYGIQTLSFRGYSQRPWGDRDDDVAFSLTPQGTAHLEWATGIDWPSPYPSTAAAETTRQPTSQPTSMPHGAEPYGGEDFHVAAFGSPLGDPSPNAFRQGRYRSLLADPLFRFGFDMRLALYFPSTGLLFFPMQTDLSAAVHPVEHLTFVVEGGLQGSRRDRAGGLVGGEQTKPFGLHETFVMTHEWPGNAYLKAGRFIPPFGWRLDDHTAPTRRLLGLDQGRPSTYVSGVEIGGVINYPFFNLAAFRLDAGQFSFWPDPETGSGVAGQTGWRDLAWGLSGSFWFSNGDIEDRRMVGASWYLNPWRLWMNVPLTYLGEVDLAFLNPTDRDRTIRQLVAFHELDWRVLPGAQLRLRWDFADPDLDASDDAWHRLNLGLDFFPYRFAEIQVSGRILVPETGATGADAMLILRGWY